MKARLEGLEKGSEQHEAVVDGLTTKYMETIERLQSDKARLEVRMSWRNGREKEAMLLMCIVMCMFVLSSSRLNHRLWRGKRKSAD